MLCTYVAHFILHLLLQVKVGNIHKIVWGIPSEGQAYEDVTVSKETTLFFKWTTGYHNLVEIRNVPTRDVCEFANPGSTGASEVGQVCTCTCLHAYAGPEIAITLC